jgi:excinuclease ABC subunit C
VEKLFVQLRDATHHAAITYHRKLRAKNSRHSVLDNISGLGPTRKRLLIARFGSVKGIAKADSAALCEIPGITPKLAETILGAIKELDSALL